MLNPRVGEVWSRICPPEGGLPGYCQSGATHMENNTMNQTTQGWPAAGIDSAEAARAFKRAIAPLQVCESTPSLIETEAGDIVAQTFERHDVDVTDKGRTAEMWARAQLMAAAPELLEALDILREGLEDRITHLGHDPADDARVKLARAAIAKALRR